MRVPPSRKAFALVATCLAIVPSCTLLNPLDHLQSGRDAEDATTTGPGDGGGTTGRDGDPRDALDLPGCEPEGWTSCGATVAARVGKPGGAVFVSLGSTTSLYFTDEGAGTVSSALCTPSRCSAPTVVVAGENAPRTIGLTGGSLAWVTGTAVRRLSIAPPSDAGPETLATPGPSAVLTAEYPHIVWTDDTGVFAFHQAASVPTKLGGGPARSPVFAKAFSWVANGMVQHNVWDGVTNVPATTTFTGTEGAEIVAAAPLYGSFLDRRDGLVASLKRDGGTELVVADRRDDAGRPSLLTVESEGIRALVTTSTYVYWTTGSGFLRRQARDIVEVTTVLNGLSGDTALAVSSAGLVAVVDRGRGEIVTYAPP